MPTQHQSIQQDHTEGGLCKVSGQEINSACDRFFRSRGMQPSFGKWSQLSNEERNQHKRASLNHRKSK